jgi:NADH dehydrogenase
MTLRVVVVGGGCAGLACLSELRVHLPAAELYLVDPDPWHLKQTRLHEAVTRPLDELRVPFAHIAERLATTHCLARAGTSGGFTLEQLEAWAAAGRLPVEPVGGSPSYELDFDFLVLATGAMPAVAASADAADAPVYSLDTLRHLELRERLRESTAGVSAPGFRVTVVGAGASGVQYAFELAEATRRLGLPDAVRVLEAGDRLLPHMPFRAHGYVLERMRAAGIEWVPCARFVEQEGHRLRYRASANNADHEVDSHLTLLLAGVRGHPVTLPANRFGQVQVEGRTLPNVFAAGDCARYDASGSNAATAQTAVRQGKHVAINVSRVRRRRDPLPWVFTELGYVVSLGVVDAVGWVLVPANILTGMSAVGVKTLVDAQYDLYLEGVDTYVL